MLNDDIPKYIDGAKTLYISKSNTEFENVVRNDIKISIKCIAVCQYDDGEGFYLFGCNKDFNTYTDFLYTTLMKRWKTPKDYIKLKTFNGCK